MPLIARLTQVVRQLAPELCPRCGVESADRYCLGCRNDFSRILSPCPRCGLPRPCRPCPATAASWSLDGVIAPFAYVAPISDEIWRLKYRRRWRLGAVLGTLTAPVIDADRVDALVPVPLHARRLRERSFNQADEIARPIAKRLARPMLVRGIERLHATAPQIELDRSARIASLAHAFSVRNPTLSGLRVAIVDDVITTGATVNALAAALRAAGAQSVVAWAVARTPNRNDPDRPAAISGIGTIRINRDPPQVVRNK